MRWEDETGWPKSVPPLTMERVFHARTWNSEKRKKEWDSGSLHTNLPRCNGSVEPFNRLGKRPKKRRYITRPRLFNTAHEVLSANGRSLQSGLFDRVRGFIFILLYPLFFFYLFYLFFLFVFFLHDKNPRGGVVRPAQPNNYILRNEPSSPLIRSENCCAAGQRRSRRGAARLKASRKSNRRAVG